jgi:hypothetical protein
MRYHRNPQARVSNKAHADNFDPGDALELLYGELVEVEALARAAGEAVTLLPSTASAKLRRIFARLHVLVTRTENEASTALTLSENLVSALSAHTAGRAPGQRGRRRRPHRPEPATIVEPHHHAATGRHAMTPRVRARTSGEVRQVATAS